jgi:hypothetical protein
LIAPLQKAARQGRESRLQPFLTGLLLAGCAMAAYAVLWRGAPFRGTDTTDYLETARAISTGHLEAFPPRTPGFPLFLLLAGTGRAFFWISMALHMAAAGMLGAVLLSMRVDRRLVAAFAVIAVLPSFVQKDAYLLTEGLFEFLLTAGFAALWAGRRHPGWLAAGGVAFGLATITRPQGQLLPFVLAALLVAFFGRREGMRRSAYLLAPFCMLVGSLMLHNLIRYHDPNLTYDLGFHLGTRTVDLFEDIPDPQVRRIMVETRDRAYGDPDRNPIWTSLYTRPELMRLKGMSMPELARYMEHVHLRLIAGHPVAYLEQVGRGLVHFWLPDLSKPTNRNGAVRTLCGGTQLALSAAFLLLAVLWGGLEMGRLALPLPQWLPEAEPRFLFTAAMAIIGYTAVLCSALDMGEARYRSTVDLLILFAVVLAAEYLGRARKRQSAGR